MKEYIEKKAAEIKELEQEKKDKIAKASQLPAEGTVIVYQGVAIRIDENARKNLKESADRSIGETRKDYEGKIEAKNQECLNHIAAEKKKLHQAIAEVEPIPTNEQLIISEQLVKQYHNMANTEKFFADMQFHIENETVKALPYYFASKELFPDDPQIDVVLRTLVPAIAEKEKELLEIEEMERVYKSFYINFQLNNTVVDNMQSIRLKHELADIEQRMKEYEQQKAAEINAPRIAEIIHALNQPGLTTIESIALKRELTELGGITQLNQSLSYVGK